MEIFTGKVAGKVFWLPKFRRKTAADDSVASEKATAGGEGATRGSTEVAQVVKGLLG